MISKLEIYKRDYSKKKSYEDLVSSIKFKKEFNRDKEIHKSMEFMKVFDEMLYSKIFQIGYFLKNLVNN